jgi:tRNA-splicing ligase RtcB
VLQAQGDTVRVLHTLTPRVVVMAGANEFDPYKDQDGRNSSNQL